MANQANPGESPADAQAGTRSHANMDDKMQSKPIEEKHLNDAATGRQEPSANPKRSPEHEPGFEAKNRDTSEEEKEFKAGIERMNKGEPPVKDGTYEQQTEFERKLHARGGPAAFAEPEDKDQRDRNVNTKQGRSQADESKAQVDAGDDKAAQDAQKAKRAHTAKAKVHVKRMAPAKAKARKRK